ncbi:carboxypeptidase-like regulatory domain-containing protein [Pseudozobellia thermophila]|nr:carboxypeptidase-like regulatory domain-containing protein [Pseudozobellia thermophila]
MFLLFSCNLLAQVDIRIKNDSVLYDMRPESKRTLVAEVENLSDTVQFVRTVLDLEDNWEIISNGFTGNLRPGEKRLVLVTVYVPNKVLPGKRRANLRLLSFKEKVLKSIALQMLVPEHHRLSISKLSSPDLVFAGETIYNKFEIVNKGNVDEEVMLHSDSDIEGARAQKIEAGSSLVITLKKETDKRFRKMKTENTHLSLVRTGDSVVTARGYALTKVYPLKMEAEDAFFRFPIEASLYYNTFNSKENNYASFMVETRGEGYLDQGKSHHFDFLVRTPNQNRVNRFGMNDQYSFTYDYDNEFNVVLGDYSYRPHRLGFVSRYGFGLKMEYHSGNTKFTTFYAKPRLPFLYTESIAGLKVGQKLSETFTVGASIASSTENVLSANTLSLEPELRTGQILVVESGYKTKNTLINHESSISTVNSTTGSAHDLSVSQKLDNVSYNGSFTFAGKNYFGGLGNSLRYANSLSYRHGKWGVGAGQALSKVNERYNPVYALPEPFYENYYIVGDYKIGKRQQVNVRWSNAVREDRQVQKSYHYKEHGLDYTYRYMHQGLSLSLNGRFSKTRNILSLDKTYRSTYGHNLSGAYRLTTVLGLRANMNHNYTNRYGISGQTSNFYNYGLGFNLNLKGRTTLSAMFNSGFSPEDSYLQRDFINLNLNTKIRRVHRLSVRLNYYENALAANRREVFSFLKYTYSLGAPLKRIRWRGTLGGSILTHNKGISVDRVKVNASGQDTYTDAFGNFEIKNLSVGTNYLVIDESTLPIGVVAVQRMPIEIDVRQDKEVQCEIELVEAAMVEGSLLLGQNKGGEAPNLEGYLKLEGAVHTYYTESDKNGKFTIKSLVPGSYELSVVRLKHENDLKPSKTYRITLAEGETLETTVELAKKDRGIKFRSSGFSVKI